MNEIKPLEIDFLDKTWRVDDYNTYYDCNSDETLELRLSLRASRNPYTFKITYPESLDSRKIAGKISEVAESLDSRKIAEKISEVAESFNKSVKPLTDSIYEFGEKLWKVAIMSMFTYKKIYFHGPATVILWGDGSKTIVRISKNDKKTKDDKRIAIMWALAKRYFGSRNQLEKRLADARAYGTKNDNATIRSILVTIFKHPKYLDEYISEMINSAIEN